MKNPKLKKLCAVLMAATISTSLFVGCGSNDTSNEQSKSNSTSTEVKQEIIYNLGADPQTIDPVLNTAIDGSNIIVNAFECLMVLCIL